MGQWVGGKGGSLGSRVRGGQCNGITACGKLWIRYGRMCENSELQNKKDGLIDLCMKNSFYLILLAAGALAFSSCNTFIHSHPVVNTNLAEM